jgi:hypothetical protein
MLGLVLVTIIWAQPTELPRTSPGDERGDAFSVEGVRLYFGKSASRKCRRIIATKKGTYSIVFM